MWGYGVTEKVKQVIITEVRLIELLIAEVELDAIKESEKRRILDAKYFDKEVSEWQTKNYGNEASKTIVVVLRILGRIEKNDEWNNNIKWETENLH